MAGTKLTVCIDVYLQGGAATCSEGFVICFLKVPLACLGSMAAAIQPNSLGNSQKTFYKTFGTRGRPTHVVTLMPIPITSVILGVIVNEVLYISVPK